MTQIHKAAHSGVDTLRKLVNKQFYWQDIGIMAKSVRVNCAGCQGLIRAVIIPKALPIPVFGVLHR